MTQTTIDVARPLAIAVHDHIVVDKQGHASLKGLRLPHQRDLIGTLWHAAPGRVIDFLETPRIAA
jgi:hypothetical protein